MRKGMNAWQLYNKPNGLQLQKILVRKQCTIEHNRFHKNSFCCHRNMTTIAVFYFCAHDVT